MLTEKVAQRGVKKSMALMPDALLQQKTFLHAVMTDRTLAGFDIFMFVQQQFFVTGTGPCATANLFAKLIVANLSAPRT